MGRWDDGAGEWWLGKVKKTSSRMQIKRALIAVVEESLRGPKCETNK